MRHLLSRIADFFRESDKFLLLLCLFASSYGCVAVFSTTYYMETFRPVLVQVLCMILGLFAAMVISVIDYENLLKRWYLVGLLGLIMTIAFVLFVIFDRMSAISGYQSAFSSQI